MAMNFSATTFFNQISEIIGYKSGVALSPDDLKSFFRENGYDSYARAEGDDWIRIHSSEFEDIIESLLYSMGRLERRNIRHPSITLFHKYKDDKELAALREKVMEAWLEWMKTEGEAQMNSGVKSLDPSSLVTLVFHRHGSRGADMLIEFFDLQNASMMSSPWSSLREIEWANEIELKGLFESEGLESLYGNFFDQRYIDFLHRNFDQIDKMHWRKFEQMTAEYLDKSGFKVDLGPGRNDNGVDVRAWLPDSQGPGPHIIVQCKRQKSAVDKVVVKALYADVVHEQATSGLLVTTSRISPGALETKTARGYPIDVADRKTLKEWLEHMRKPGVGAID